MNYDEYFDNSERWDYYHDSLEEDLDGKRDKIIDSVNNFNLKPFFKDDERITFILNDSKKPVTEKRGKSVTVMLMYSERIENVVKNTGMELEIFIDGKSTLTLIGKAPKLALELKSAVTNICKEVLEGKKLSKKYFNNSKDQIVSKTRKKVNFFVRD